MKDAPSRWAILPLTVCIAGCSGAPKRPGSVGRVRLRRQSRERPGFAGNGLSDRLHFEALHGDRRHAACRTGKDGHRSAPCRPSPRVLDPDPIYRFRFNHPGSIMTHHSGLPSDYLKGMWTRNPESFTRVADRLKDEYAANPPGTVFSYSNLGVTLLGDAIGKVAGRDFASHVRDEVLLPPGMGETVRVVTINGENMLSYSGYLLRKKGK